MTVKDKHTVAFPARQEDGGTRPALRSPVPEPALGGHVIC